MKFQEPTFVSTERKLRAAGASVMINRPLRIFAILLVGLKTLNRGGASPGQAAAGGSKDG